VFREWGVGFVCRVQVGGLEPPLQPGHDPAPNRDPACPPDPRPPGLLVDGFEIWVPGSGFWVPDFGFRVSGFGFRVPGSGFQVSGFGFRVSGSGFRVPGFAPPPELVLLLFHLFVLGPKISRFQDEFKG